MNTKQENQRPLKMIVPFIGIPFVEHVSVVRSSSYAAEWISKAMGFHIKSTNEVTSGTTWYDYLRALLPLTILSLLKMRGIEGTTINIDAVLSNERKIDWLQQELYLRKKPILLFVKGTTLHWIVLAGYNNEDQTFYVYDPSFGKSSLSKELPVGNKAVDYQRLVNEWGGSWNFKFTTILILNEYVTSDEEAESAEVSQKEERGDNQTVPGTE